MPITTEEKVGNVCNKSVKIRVTGDPSHETYHVSGKGANALESAISIIGLNYEIECSNVNDWALAIKKHDLENAAKTSERAKKISNDIKNIIEPVQAQGRNQ